MKIRRSIAAFGALLLNSTCAVTAQAQTGSLTVAPLGQSAPAVGVAALLVLAVLMSSSAWFLLRRRQRTAGSLLSLLALATFATAAYAAASADITVSGEDCDEPTTFAYDSGDEYPTLTSECDRPIKIIGLDPNCGGDDGAKNPECVVGLVLNEDDVCNLPSCYEE